MNPDEVIKARIQKGEENAVQCKMLEEVTGLTGREVKSHIEALRRAGTVICSSNRGYYFPACPEELRIFIARERKRACSIRRTLESSEKMYDEWGGDG